jgi:hypothetical protein
MFHRGQRLIWQQIQSGLRASVFFVLSAVQHRDAKSGMIAKPKARISSFFKVAFSRLRHRTHTFSPANDLAEIPDFSLRRA